MKVGEDVAQLLPVLFYCGSCVGAGEIPDELLGEKDAKTHFKKVADTKITLDFIEANPGMSSSTKELLMATVKKLPENPMLRYLTQSPRQFAISSLL